jgi:hypothetical protein
MLIALVAAAGLGVAALGPWRTGLIVMGCALFAGALARLVIADELAGMLKVRRKTLDVCFLTAVGAGLVTLAIVVPRPPI